MTLKQRFLKRLFEIKNKALRNNDLEILNFANTLLYAIETNNWKEFMQLLEILKNTPIAAEIAMISGFLKEDHSICLTAR